ncbi:MAG: MATE family efflux transporter [Hyphomicrobium sp.]
MTALPPEEPPGAPPLRRGQRPAKFVTGSILRHILEMTGAGAVGLMAIFVGDLANIYFLSRLGDEAVIAAVGYASSILFVSTSIGIGLSIAATSLVAPAIGAGLRVRARRLSAHAHVMTVALSALLSLAMWFAIDPMLAALGATGRTLELASGYLSVLIPTLPMLALGMTSAAVLRSVGDARRAMHITLAGAVVNTLLDVLLIVQLGWGIEGAAIATAISRIAILGIGLYGVIAVHRLMGRPKRATLAPDAVAFSAIALPAVLTNIATPVSNAYVTWAIAAYGDGAVAGWAIIGRIIPVAFGAIYALSGSVGPILGQNFGARAPDRMEKVFTQSLIVMAGFTAVAWLLLATLAHPLADAFNAGAEARRLIVFFCRWLAPLFVFLGALFIANAAFNTLGRPHYSTALNWGRATVGTAPFVLAGGAWAGADGVLAGNMIGGVAFGVVSVLIGYRLIRTLFEPQS